MDYAGEQNQWLHLLNIKERESFPLFLGGLSHPVLVFMIKQSKKVKTMILRMQFQKEACSVDLKVVWGFLSVYVSFLHWLYTLKKVILSPYRHPLNRSSYCYIQEFWSDRTGLSVRCWAKILLIVENKYEDWCSVCRGGLADIDKCIHPIKRKKLLLQLEEGKVQAMHKE